jgi:hypothetical protein
MVSTRFQAVKVMVIMIREIKVSPQIRRRGLALSAVVPRMRLVEIYLITFSLLIDATLAWDHSLLPPRWRYGPMVDPYRRQLSMLIREIEFRSREETGCQRSLEDMYNFLGWAIDQKPTQPDNSMFQCNRRCWSTWNNPWSNGYETHWNYGCQDVFQRVQRCIKARGDTYNDGFRRLVAAKCQGLNHRVDKLTWLGLDEITAPREHEHRNVTFEECLEYTGIWKALPVSALIEHMEGEGGRSVGGCLGHMIFDTLAAKALNPLIPLPVRKESEMWIMEREAPEG